MKNSIVKFGVLTAAGLLLNAGTSLAGLTFPDTPLSDDQDSYWTLGPINPNGVSAMEILLEQAAFRFTNTFGIYQNGQYVELFSGPDAVGDRVRFAIAADGEVKTGTPGESLTGTGVIFNADNPFGFYLDASAETRGGLWHSDTSLNDDGADHMYAYFPGSTNNQEVWGAKLAFEDLRFPGSDADFTDFVLKARNVEPVPEPATMLLFGTGLAGLAGAARRKMAKK